MSTHASQSFISRAGLVSALASLAIACSPNIDVFGNESSGAASQGGGSSSGGSSSGGSSSGGSSSGGHSAGGSTSTQNPDTSTSTTSPTTTTSMNDTVTTGPEPTVTTGPPPGPTVDCNGSQCEVSQGNVCCFDQQALTEQCTDAGNCQTGFENDLVAIQCQTPDDCDGGLICCAHREFGSQSPYDRTSCEVECAYPDLYLCDIASPDCPTYQDQNGNPLPSVCKQSQLLPFGYYICGLNN